MLSVIRSASFEGDGCSQKGGKDAVKAMAITENSGAQFLDQCWYFLACKLRGKDAVKRMGQSPRIAHSVHTSSAPVGVLC
eukprot:1158112-Pelagomonas_calceolata.AAC.2